MLSKKSIILCAALLLPTMAAQAAVLVTTNNTAQPSTVKINSGVCVGTLPAPMGVVTPPHGGVTRVQQDSVNLLCGGKAKHVCVADIHMTTNCSDPAIATAVFNLDTFSITSVAMRAGVPYRIDAAGTNVVINPA
ncbi:MAG: hypothetical protein ACYCQI_04290 [Gammaproteobacteria bacterium]